MPPRLRIVPLVIALALAGACVPAEPATNVVVHYDPAKTKMGAIQQRGSIVIGVPSDRYPFGYVGSPSAPKETPSSSPKGFTVGLGKLVADALGVKARYIAAPSDKLLGLVDSNQADVVFPMVPITQDAVAAHTFSDPYFVGHQRLLVPGGSAVRQVADLKGESVCSAIDPKTEFQLTHFDPNIVVLPVTSPTECVKPVDEGKVAAATGADVVLMGIKAQVDHSQITGDQLTTEGYGAAVNPCDPGLAEFVSRVFGNAVKEGRWTALYKQWILPASGSNSIPNPPTMTVGDAWDLYPPTSATPSPAPLNCPTPASS
jgi:polar amino acid transport system substrate-binding protein